MENNTLKIKRLAQKQCIKGAMLSWGDYQYFIFCKEKFKKYFDDYKKETDDEKINEQLNLIKLFNKELNNLRIKSIKESVLPVADKKIFYEMINFNNLKYIRKLDDIIIKMYDTKKKKSIFEGV